MVRVKYVGDDAIEVVTVMRPSCVPVSAHCAWYKVCHLKEKENAIKLNGDIAATTEACV